MKKPEGLTKGEELLTQALEECLDEDLSFVPPEGEIARTHRFSDQFAESMANIMEHREKDKEIRRHFTPRYGHLAACVLVFCICGALFLGVLYPEWSGSAGDENAGSTAASEDAAAAESADITEESAYGEEAPEAAAAEGSAADETVSGITAQSEAAAEEETAADSGGTMAAEKEYCGQTVYLADQQEVPETLDGVTVKVNSPVQDEENPLVYLTIGNIGEDPVEYLDGCSLEVWLDDGWYAIPSNNETTPRTQELEAGMAVDEIVDLNDYEIDYSARKYRLVTQVNGEKIGAEFTFSEEFSESMSE